MKYLICLIFTVAFTTTLVSADDENAYNPARLPTGLVPKKFSHAQREARRQRILKTTGGRIRNLEGMRGVVKFLDAQKSVSVDILQNTASVIGSRVQCNIQVAKCEKKITPANAASERVASGANVVVFLVDDDELPAFLVAPEEKWAIINAKALSAGETKPETVSIRLSREMWRSLGYMVGSFSLNENCLMRPIYSLNDLDNAGVDELSYEPVYRMQMGLRSAGIHPYVVATYKRACEEGWAPAPTNDIQKAIWDEAHSEKEKGPVNAIKITPPRK